MSQLDSNVTINEKAQAHLEQNTALFERMTMAGRHGKKGTFPRRHFSQNSQNTISSASDKKEGRL